MVPISDIHLELWRLEQAQRSARTAHLIGDVEKQRTVTGDVRLRIGQALIAGGRALGASTPADRPVVHNRPVSAHR